MISEELKAEAVALVTIINRGDDALVRASTSQLVDLSSILLWDYTKEYKTASLLDDHHER